MRFADALLIFVDGQRRHDGLLRAVEPRLREALAPLHVTLHADQRRIVDLVKGERGGLLGVALCRLRGRKGNWGPYYAPQMHQRPSLLRRRNAIFRRTRSPPLDRVIPPIQPILRGRVHSFAIGHASRCFSEVRDWGARKIRRHLRRARQRKGFGWQRWSRQGLYRHLGWFGTSRVSRPQQRQWTALPGGEGPDPLRRSKEGRVVRDIRMLRAMRRELDTELRDGLRHRQMAQATG